MSEKLLLLDVGNTSIKVGLATPDLSIPLGEPGALLSYTLPTDHAATPDSLGLNLIGLLGHAGVRPDQIRACLACSVVPMLDPMLRMTCDRYIGQSLSFVPADLPVPLENRYERPQEVGADRLVGAWAARRLYPNAPLIVVDFGTATTFDCVRDNAYLGGLICPGVLSSARALSTRTAKLPQIRLRLDVDEPMVGKSTSQSLNQGFMFGFAAMVEGVCARLRKQLGSDTLVIAAGGMAQDIARVGAGIDHVRPDLLITGLRGLYCDADRGMSSS